MDRISEIISTCQSRLSNHQILRLDYDTPFSVAVMFLFHTFM